jgi:hypothetical protein
MNRILVLLLLFLSTSAWSETPVSLYDGKLKFDAPAEFRPMAPELIAVKFPRGSGPQHVYSDAKTTATSIAFTHSLGKLTDERLEEFREALVSMLSASKPGIIWIKKEIVVIQGRRWARLECTTPGADSVIHNEILVTPLDGRVLLVNLNTLNSLLPSAGSKLAAVKASLRLAP